MMPHWDPVYAIANGVVTFQGWGEAYGLWVCVRHENGLRAVTATSVEYWLKKVNTSVNEKSRAHWIDWAFHWTAPLLRNNNEGEAY